MRRPVTPGTWIGLAAFVLAIAGTLVVLFAPLATVVSMQAAVPGEVPHAADEMSRISIVERGEWDVIWLTAIPVALAGLPLLFARTRFAQVLFVISAALLSTLAFLAIIGIGWAYLPAAVTMWIAAALEGRRSKAVAAGST